MLNGFSEGERIAIIGLIASVSGAFITFMGVFFTSWTTIYLTRINKERNEAEKQNNSVILVSSQSAKALQNRTKFKIRPFWIPIVLSVGLFLTILFILTFEHRRHKEAEKHIFRSPDYYAEVGNQYLKTEDFINAELMYRQALEVDDADAQTHSKLAIALREQGKLEEALEENFAAVAIDSTVGEFHFHKGITLQRLGTRKYASGIKGEAQKHFENAEEAFQKAIQREPLEPKYHFNLAIVINDMSRYVDAEQECLAAIELDPNNAEYHFFLTTVIKDETRHEDAKAEYLTAIGMEPDNAEYHRRYALFLSSQNCLENALHETQKAAELNPYDAAYNLMGSILSLLGRQSEAEDAYRRAFHLSPA